MLTNRLDPTFLYTPDKCVQHHLQLLTHGRTINALTFNPLAIMVVALMALSAVNYAHKELPV